MKKLLLSMSFISAATISMAQAFLPKPATQDMNLKSFITASDLPDSKKAIFLAGLKFAQQKPKSKTAKTTASGDRLVDYSTYTYYGSYELSDTSHFSWGGGRVAHQYANYLYGELPNVDYEKYDRGIGLHNDGGVLENQWKTLHTFDATDNMTEEISQQYNTDKAIWLNAFRSTATYSGTKTSEYINQDWDTIKSAWKNTNRYLYTYTATDAIASMTLQNWDTTSAVWVNYYRYTDTYTGTELQSRVAQYWNTGTGVWDNSVYFKYNYSGGLNRGYVAHSWNASTSTWMKGYRDTNTYAGTDLAETINQNWVTSTSLWQNNYRDSFTYSGGKLTVSSRRNWDAVLNAWTTGSKNLITYDGDKMTSYVSQKWTGGDIYENELKGEYIYTGGNLTEFIRSNWNTATSTWDNKGKRDFTFNSNNSVLSAISFDWTSGAWSPLYSNESATYYYYEAYTGIAEQNKELHKVSVFPNPSTAAILYVDYFTENADATEVVLSNVMGQQQYRSPEAGSIGDHSVALPVSSLPSGMYFISIYSNDRLMHTAKVIR